MKVTQTPTQQHTPDAPPWPDGVYARYLTAAGATVDLRAWDYREDPTEEAANADAECLGCGERYAIDRQRNTRAWAQGHAEKCRALPRPAVTA